MNKLISNTDSSEIIYPPLASNHKSKNIKSLDKSNKKKLIIELFKNKKEINKSNMNKKNNSKLFNITPQKITFQSFSKNKSKLIKNKAQKKFNILTSPKITVTKSKEVSPVANENNKPKKSINEIFESLVDIRTQLKNLEIKSSKITKTQSNMNNPKKSIFLSSYNNQINLLNSTQKTFRYEKNKTKNYFFGEKIFPKKKSKVFSATKKSIIDMNKNLKRSSQSIIMNNHIKYIQRIRDKELVDLVERYKKSMNKNRVEEINHYVNHVFPNELIQYLIALKRQLTIDKYKNEYISKMDRYKTNSLMKAIKNQNSKYKLSRNTNNN